MSPARDLKNSSSPPGPLARDGSWRGPGCHHPRVPSGDRWLSPCQCMDSQAFPDGITRLFSQSDPQTCTKGFCRGSTALIPAWLGTLHTPATPRLVQRTVPTPWLFPMDVWGWLFMLVQWVIADEYLPNCTMWNWMEGTCYWWHNTL